MSEHNLRIWNELKITDPAATSSFRRPGGFRGTAVKPTWIARRLTEVFGPVGIGWGVVYDDPIFKEAGGQILVYQGACVWYRDPESGEIGHSPKTFGGDFVAKANKEGQLIPDDEAMKKAATDAWTKASSFLGVAADVHAGAFDNSKYVETARNYWRDKQSGKKEEDDEKASRADSSDEPAPQPAEGAPAEADDVPEPPEISEYALEIEQRIVQKDDPEVIRQGITWIEQNLSGRDQEHLLQVARERVKELEAVEA